MIVVALVALSLMFAHRHLRAAGWDDPAVIHAVAWTVVSICCALLPELDGYPSWKTIAILSLGLIAFSVGILMAERVALAKTRAFSADWPGWLPWVLALLSTAGLIAVAIRANQLVPFNGRADWFPLLRSAVTVRGLTFGWAGYLANLGLAAAIAAVFVSKRIDQHIATSIAVFAAALTALLLTGRTFIMLLAVLVLSALSSRVRSDVTKNHLGIIALVVALVAMFLATIARQLTSASLDSMTITLYSQLLHYIPAGVIAFDAQVISDTPASFGIYTFRTVLAVLKVLGFDVPVADLLRPYIHNPISTNVYTALSPYYADFGILGVLVFFLTFGFLTAMVRRQVQRAPSPALSMVYGILLYALIMQFFQDQYFSLLSQWIQLIFWIVALTYPTRVRS